MNSVIWFLFNPLMGFWNAMKALDRKANGWVFVAFYALFGYAISFNLESADSYRIAARFCQTEFSYSLVWEMYREGEITDVYLIFVYSVVKLFTNNPKVLYGILGAVMGVFSYLSIKQLFLIWKGKRNRYFYICVFVFFLAISFFNVNGIRFWTATSYFSLFAVRYFYFNKKGALVLLLLAPLFHYGYLLAVIAALLFVLLRTMGIRTQVFYWLMVAAFGLSIISPTADDILGAEGDVSEFSGHRKLDYKIQRYTNTGENIAESQRRMQEDISLYRRANRLFTRTFDYVNKIGMFIMLTIHYIERRRTVMDRRQVAFFNYVLFSYAVAFFATVMIDSGVRFLRLAGMMYALWLMAVFINNASIKWKRYVYLLLVVNFYSIAFLFFNSPRLVTPLFWFAPPVFTIIDGIGFAPIDFI